MKLFDDYLDLQKQIFDYFGYVEDWKAIPLDDCRTYYWQLAGEGPGSVLFGETVDSIDTYEHIIYTQRFLPKWVYRGKDYTMICVDTQTDGNKFLSIFDNSKEVK